MLGYTVLLFQRSNIHPYFGNYCSIDIWHKLRNPQSGTISAINPYIFQQKTMCGYVAM